MDIIDKKELLGRLGISYPTLLAMQKKGMPVIQFGAKTHRYNWEQVVNWLSSNADAVSYKGQENGKN